MTVITASRTGTVICVVHFFVLKGKIIVSDLSGLFVVTGWLVPQGSIQLGFELLQGQSIQNL